MACGEDRRDCVIGHILPVLGGRAVKTGRQWSAQCPACKSSTRCLSITLGSKGRRFVWKCHRGCDEMAVHAAMVAASVPAQCIPLPGQRQHAPRTVDREALVELAHCDLPASAYKLALMRLAGVSPQDARRELKLRESTYYDAMRALSGLRISGERRRSE